MPLINDYTEGKRKPFKKKPYRPWSLLEDLSSPTIVSVAENTAPSSLEPEQSSTINSDQLGDNKGTNKGTHKGTIRVQLGDNKGTEKSLLGDNKGTHRGTHKGTNKGTIRGQADENSHLQDIHNEIEYLQGCQRQILFFIANDCFAKGTLISQSLSLETLKNILNFKGETIKTSIKRLVHKGFIQRVKGRRGVGGFTSFRMTELVRNIAVEKSKQYSAIDELGDNKGTHKGTHRGTDKGTIVSSSSSNNIINTTTGAIDSVLEPDWQALDLEPLATVGFSIHHLKQLATQGKLSPLEVQDSIYAFAFDLQENHKGKNLKTAPLNFFMGILRNGQVYTPPENYESPQDRSRRLYLERKRQQHEQRLAQERELLGYAFEEWYLTLTPQEISRLAPYIKGEKGRKAVLLDHFQRELWEKKKEEMYQAENL